MVGKVGLQHGITGSIVETHYPVHLEALNR